ncbi:hypothetical protein, partial [Xanthomonas oryzae]|uniref:hypothetical protein n=1 Tax=Xanthomonas oryzae TaxID=347 RepID=UPI001C4A80C5
MEVACHTQNALWARCAAQQCRRQPRQHLFQVANSTLIRNAFEDLLGEDFEGRFESKYLARTIV